MSTDISSGGVYQILSNYRSGRSVSVPPDEGTGLFLLLEDDTNSDSERVGYLNPPKAGPILIAFQWVFRAADEPNTFTIQSHSRPSYYAAQNPPFGYVWQGLPDSPITWYLQQVNDMDSSLDPQYNYRSANPTQCISLRSLKRNNV